jgi:Asp/Glu/hydantoin racemase
MVRGGTVPRILLINPNTSVATTEQMAVIARAAAPGNDVVGVCARRGPPMILTREELAAAEPEVVAIGIERAREVDGIVIAAFGDPGLAMLRDRVDVPVVGIAEASMLEAAKGGRRFGVATTTPALVEIIAERARALGLAAYYRGIRLTSGDPLALVADPAALVEALAGAVRQSVEEDGAEAVIIGGGPLGLAAAALAPRFATAIIAPIPSAMRRLLATMK